MRILPELPRVVREVENLWIELADGTRLAARMWLPEEADANPVPAILEYIPYRKRDFTTGRDEPMHRYFAGHGYAAIRVDMRGSGDSDGVMQDEYTAQELADGVEVIAWLARQPWCSGKVGMMGNSWGGFNALQVAALRPPALKAIITLVLDRRPLCRRHPLHGRLPAQRQHGLGHDLLRLMLPLPPDPQPSSASKWREMWLRAAGGASALARSNGSSHQRRDAYWQPRIGLRGLRRHRLPRSMPSAAGTTAIPMPCRGCWPSSAARARGLIGPWAHMPIRIWACRARPSPILQEAVRWWDHWLKGRDTGIMDEPMLRAWMLEPRAAGTLLLRSSIPAAGSPRRSGRAPRIAQRTAPSQRWPTDARRPDRQRRQAFQIRSTTGLAGGECVPLGRLWRRGPDFPGDQRRGRWQIPLSSNGEPLSERSRDPGRAGAAASHCPPIARTAFVAARLCDVAPDGASTRITYRRAQPHPS